MFNLGKTAEKLDQNADAIRYLEGYLAATPTASDADEVRAKLADLRLRTVAPTPPAPPPPPPSRVPPIPALVLMGSGAGILIIGIGCGAGALAAAKTVEGSGGQIFKGAPGDTYAQGQALNAAGIALDVIGGLALAAGGAWTGYWLYKRHKASPTNHTCRIAYSYGTRYRHCRPLLIRHEVIHENLFVCLCTNAQ